MRFLFSAIILFCVTTAFTQNAIQSKTNQLAQSEMMKHGQLGVYVVEVNSGRVLAKSEANKSLIPASTLKAVVTASALKMLGASYRFKTELQYDGIISNGILKGNLYIKGYGDPTLASDQMDEADELEVLQQTWVAAIKKAGIRQINGAIVGDGSYFKGNIAGKSWQWNDLGNYYASGAWGLNFHENLYHLYLQKTASVGGTPKVVRTQPRIPNLQFVNELKSAGRNTGDNAYIYGGPYADTRVVRGTIPSGSGTFKIKGSIPDPPFLAAHSLLTALENAGIQTQKRALTHIEVPQKSRRQILHTHYSPTLSEITKRANHKSVNLYCEAMIRAIGAKNNAKNSLEGGIEAIEDYWEAQGLNISGLFLSDGSGLSPRNGITPSQLAGIMRLVARDRALFNTFYTTLPIGGQSGTIKYLFKGTAAAGNVRAKSGSIGRVRSYTGYAKTSSGKLLAFAVIANNYKGSSRTIRRELEKLIISFCL
ncbi:MAG: D-alanyl-D-alanine carboxypeptidase/D-alanyl-D-alanine-endopeptidase [Bacteroidota bacterium]